MAAGPWDNVQLPGPPNGPAWAQAAAQLMGATGNAVNSGANAFQNWQNFNYQQAQRDFFQNPQNQAALSGFLQNPSPQNPAYASLLQSMIQQGGTPVAGPLINQIISDRMAGDAAKAILGKDSPPVNNATGTNSSATGPANLTGNFQSQPSPRIPYSNLSAGELESDQNTVSGIANAAGVDVNGFLTKYPKFQSLVDTDLSPAQAKMVAAAVRKYGGNGSEVPNNPVPQSGTSGDEQGQHIPPSGVGGSSAMSPRQTGERQIAQAAQAQPAPGSFRDRFNAATEPPRDRPSPLGTVKDGQAKLEEARRYRAAAAINSNRNPGAAKQFEDLGKAAEEQGKQILESVSKYNEPGRETRDVESGAKQKAADIQADTARYAKDYEKYQNQADQAHQMLQTNSITKSIMDDPNFYSGAGADYVLAVKRLGVALGLSPADSAKAMEVFGKTVSAAIVDQIRSLGGQGLGQVRVAEINIMRQAAENHDNTPASNRLLNEIQDRLARRWTIPIAEAAQQYNGGHLDVGFDRWKSQYMNSHPLFSKEELADTRRISPPLARTPADLAKMGWKDGEPFRTPDGRILTHAPKSGTPAAPTFNPNGA